ncbi:MAG: PD-(D/E)XK nuclease family protein [Planctomycetia bacterium]|nr:PD-(D/E)XK nuclease family protein [Planctomycetia bacterium]
MIRAPVRPATRASPAPQPTPPKPARDYLSYSAVTTYQGCPLRYFFRYIAGLPERTVSSSLVFGSAIHRAVEYHFNELLAGNEPPTAEALLGEYDRHWRETNSATVRFGKGENLDGLGDLARRVIAAFQTSSLAVPNGQIIGVEEELREPLLSGCPDVLGRIDLLVETVDELIVTDFKTSRSRWSRAQADDSAGQLLLYHELVRDFAPRKRLRLQFAVITKTKEPSIDLLEVAIDRKRIDRTKRVMERVWKAIEAKSFYPAPSAMQCPTCPFREPCRKWNG